MLLPVVGFVGVAYYWSRIEQVSPPRGGGMFVERVKLITASGRSREAGASHSLVVTVDHLSPKPRFWGNPFQLHGGLRSFQKPIHLRVSVKGVKPDDCIASLGEVIWAHDGKREVILQNGRSVIDRGGDYQKGKYVFVQDLDLQKIGPEGEVTFHGAYVVAGRPALEIRRVIRKAAEKLTFDGSRYTCGNVVSVTAGNWMTINSSVPSRAGGFKTMTEDVVAVAVRVRQSRKPIVHPKRFPLVYDVEIVDGKGRVHPYFKGGFTTMGTSLGDAQNLPPEQVELKITPTLAANFKPTNPLTLRGKVSIDDNWPIPFSVRLQKH